MSRNLLSGVQDLKDVLQSIKLSNIIWINKTRIIKIKSSYSSFIVELWGQKNPYNQIKTKKLPKKSGLFVVFVQTALYQHLDSQLITIYI
jgi:hypothetical protein